MFKNQKMKVKIGHFLKLISIPIASKANVLPRKNLRNFNEKIAEQKDSSGETGKFILNLYFSCIGLFLYLLAYVVAVCI